MNFKKRFEKRIEEDKKSMYTESDMAFLATLQNMVVGRPDGEVVAKRIDYKKPLLIAGACFLVVALALSLILYYTLSSTSVGEKYYLDYNRDSVESTVEELNSALDLFSFEANESLYNIDVKKYYDKESEDTLYYNLSINTTHGLGFNAEIDIVVNKNFIHDSINYRSEKLESMILGYTLIYTHDITPTAITGINTVNCMGEIKVGNQWIYINSYEELSMGEGTFVETLQSMIHIK